MKKITKTYAYFLILLIPPILLAFAWPYLGDSPVAAQVLATPCGQSAPEFYPGGKAPAVTATPMLPCPPTATIAPSVTTTLTPNGSQAGDLEGTPTLARSNPSMNLASTCGSNSTIDTLWAIIATHEEQCFIDAVTYSNGLASGAPPYQIYLTGALTFNNSTLVLPLMTRALEIYGNNSLFTLTADNPLRFSLTSTGSAYILSHMVITNGGNYGTRTYGGAVRNLYKLKIYDSVFDDNAAINGGGAIYSSNEYNTQASLYLERVRFTNNHAGGGSAIQTEYGAQLTGDCVAFQGNSGHLGPLSGYGQSVLLGTGGGTVSLRRSGFRTKYVAGVSSGTYAQLFNLTADPFAVNDSYFKPATSPGISPAAVVTNPDYRLEVSANVSVYNPRVTDPTLDAGCTFLLPKTPPQQSGTPIPEPCSFEPENPVFVYRAPIPGNPIEDRVDIQPLKAERYYVDEIMNILWLEVQNDESPVQEIDPIWRWSPVFITDVDTQGELVVDTITIKSPPPPWFTGSVKISKAIASACLNEATDAKQQFPLPTGTTGPGIDWGVPPRFSVLPLSDAKICAGYAVDGRHEFHGLGYSTLSQDDISEKYPPRGWHYGIDFFAPVGAVAYSISDGIVVGTGTEEDEVYTSAGRWLSADIKGENVKGHSVVVRYGQFYVLYGHLQEINAQIYVGKVVTKGTPLGTIGLSEYDDPTTTPPPPIPEPHLHLELRLPPNPILASNRQLVITPLMQNNKWGILRLDGKQIEDLIDAIQWYADPAQVIQNDTTGYASTLAVTGFSTPTNLQGELPLLGFSCSTPMPVTYLTNVDDPVVTTTPSGFRGFSVLDASVSRDPLNNPISPTP